MWFMRHGALLMVVVGLLWGCDRQTDEQHLYVALLKLAEGGNSEAQYHVGMMLNSGLGIERDSRRAFEWFKRAAASNDPLGAYKVGCYFSGQVADIVARDPAKALEHKLIAAKAGYALAQYDVGNHHARTGDTQTACSWWKAAGDQGFPDALYRLSIAHQRGDGCSKDPALAYAYLRLAQLASGRATDPKAQAAFEKLSGEISDAELSKGDAFVSQWRAIRTPLTAKAMRGIAAADELVRSASTN